MVEKRGDAPCRAPSEHVERSKMSVALYWQLGAKKSHPNKGVGAKFSPVTVTFDCREREGEGGREGFVRGDGDGCVLLVAVAVVLLLYLQADNTIRNIDESGLV